MNITLAQFLASSSIPLGKFTPESFPLPQRGADPFFGVGRSSYYDLERRGLLKLIRLRKPGQLRGKVLVPYADMAECLRRMQTPAKP
jgi:hypothetical protein